MTVTKLDPDEHHFTIPGPRDGMSLFLRWLPSKVAPASRRRAVIYVHGATFSSALSIAYRFEGRSWRDALCDAGFDVWGLDFYGFGNSSRYPEMLGDAWASAPLCTAEDAAIQIECAARFILAHQDLARVSVISHSWGSMPTGLFASMHRTLMDRWVLFAPISKRPIRPYESPPDAPAWKLVSLEDQWNRFVEDVPAMEAPVLDRKHFEAWGREYLDSDPGSRTRERVGVKVPNGPFSEILRAWHGQLAYEPSNVQSPVAIIRGEWDGLVRDSDARWLFDAFTHAPIKRDIKISRGTHLMHLETMRFALWEESIAFLSSNESSQFG
jgi:pimeloyl-ACP methyl ester carboxylesterase